MPKLNFLLFYVLFTVLNYELAYRIINYRKLNFSIFLKLVIKILKNYRRSIRGNKFFFNENPIGRRKKILHLARKLSLRPVRH